MKKNSTFNDKSWFYGFSVIHVFFWTLLPTLLRYCLPLDAMEGTTWGRQLALGYDKNPFLNAWLTEFAVWFGGHSGWAVYCLSQLCIVVCFWAVWQLGRKMVSPIYALIAVILLEFISNYNIDAIDFDDNVLQVAFWALIILFFYRALMHQKYRDWVFVGIFSALAMLAKYYVVVLFFSMGLFLIVNPLARKSFEKKGLYLAGFVFILLLIPHIIFLIHHDFLTVRYAFFRAGHHPVWYDHLSQPLHFLLSYLGAIMLPLLVFGTLYLSKLFSSHLSSEVLSSPCSLSYFQWRYLLFMGFAPFLVTIGLSVLTGMSLHLGWGQPLLSFWGLILVSVLQPRITRQSFYRFILITAFLFSAILMAYFYSTWYAGHTSSANYPGKTMADRITQLWHERYHQKLEYVIGPRWEAGVVSFYSKDRPSVYIQADSAVSFWINPVDLKKRGGVVLWNDHKDDSPPVYEILKKQYPRLQKPFVETFYWKRTGERMPIYWHVAYLPPAHFFQ